MRKAGLVKKNFGSLPMVQRFISIGDGCLTIFAGAFPRMPAIDQQNIHTMRTNWIIFKTGLLAGCWCAVVLTAAAQEPPKYRYSAWGGATYRLASDTEVNAGWGLTLGSALRLGKSETRLLLFYSTVPAERLEYQEDWRKSGIQGELSFGIQHSSRGRLTGKVNPFFYGLEWRLGRQAHRYTIFHAGQNFIEQRLVRWQAVCLRTGYRIQLDQWFFDLVVPIGMEFTRSQSNNTQYHYDYRSTAFTLRPTLQIGIQF